VKGRRYWVLEIKAVCEFGGLEMAQEFQLDTHPGHSLHLLLFTDVENGR